MAAADRPVHGPVRCAPVLPIGFGEGFPHLPPCHEVLVHGQRAPVLSRRGIEHTVIDVTGYRARMSAARPSCWARRGRTRSGRSNLRARWVPLLELLPRLARCAPQRYVRTVGSGQPDWAGVEFASN